MRKKHAAGRCPVRSVACGPVSGCEPLPQPPDVLRHASPPFQATKSGTGGGAFTVRLLSLSTGAITPHCAAPGVEEHDLATTAGLQVFC